MRIPLCLGFFVLATIIRAAPTPDETLPATRALLEVDAPDGARVAVEGTPAPGGRATFDGLDGGLVRKSVEVTLAGGVVVRRDVFLRGGWRVRLPILAPGLVRPRSVAPGAGAALVSQAGHTRPITALAYSVDGKQILTGSRDRTAILWNAATGERVRSFEAPGDVVWVAFGADGRQGHALTAPGGLLAWDLATGARGRSAYGVEVGGPRSNLDPEIVAALRVDGRSAVLGVRNTGFQDAAYVDLEKARLIRPLRLADARKSESLLAAALTPDGKQLATFHLPRTAKIWDLATGQVVHSWQPPDRVTAAAYSPDGKWLLGGTSRGTLHLWDAVQRVEVRQYANTGAQVSAVAFSPDGAAVLAAGRDHKVRVWDVGGELRPVLEHRGGTFDLHDRVGGLAAFGPEGKTVVTAMSCDQSAILWDAATGKPLRTFQGARAAPGVTPAVGGKPPTPFVAFSADGSRLAARPGREQMLIWDPETGQPIFVVPNSAEASTLAFSPDGKALFTYERYQGRLWDIAEKRSRPLNNNEVGWGLSAAFSADSRRLATGGEYSGTVRVWNVLTPGKGPTRTLDRVAPANVNALAFTPDGQHLLASSSWGKVLEFAPGSKKPRELIADTGGAATLAFSRDGGRLLVGPGVGAPFPGADPRAPTGGPTLLLDAASGKLLTRFVALSVTACALSPDGRLVLTGATDGTVTLWDASTGRALRVLKGHTDVVNAVAFRGEGRQFASASTDGSTRLWDAATGDELVRLLHAGGGDWAVVTPEGLFDGSPGGRQKITFRIGERKEVVPLDRFFRDAYEPGLLARLARGERPVPGNPFPAQPAPLVRAEVTPRTGGEGPDQAILQVAVTDQGGGSQAPVVRHNGAPLRLDIPAEQDGKVRRYRLPVRLVPGDNRFDVRSASADGAWESEPAVTSLRFDGELPKPDLYVLAVGVNHYAEASGVRPLRYAVPDARAVAALFRERPAPAYRAAYVTPLLDGEATRARILAEVRGLAKRARPQDVLVVYVASHGFTLGQRYYLLPHDYRSPPAPQPEVATALVVGQRGVDKQREAELRRSGLAADDLADALAEVPALKRVLIFDTCQSGGAVAWAGSRRGAFAHRGAVERLGRSQGVWSLSATVADEAADENPELEHGILTYALLAGAGAAERGPLKGSTAPPAADGQLGVLEWFRYAREQVPVLNKEFSGGLPRHAEVSGEDQPSFPLLRTGR